MLIKKVQLFVFLKSLLICWHFKKQSKPNPGVPTWLLHSKIFANVHERVTKYELLDIT